MNRLDSAQLCSMTRGPVSGDLALHEPISFLYPLSCRAAVASISSSLLPKKSSFQITHIVRNPSCGDNDYCRDNCSKLTSSAIAVDDRPMSFAKIAENGSVVMDSKVIVSTETNCSTGVLKAEIKRKAGSSAGGDVQSRFRIVKIESKEQFKRGRWTCRDFADPPEAKTAATGKTSSNSGTIAGVDTASTKSVYYMPGAGSDTTNSQFIFYSEGHPVLESDAIPAATSELLNAVDLSSIQGQRSAELVVMRSTSSLVADDNRCSNCSSSIPRLCCSSDATLHSSQDGGGGTKTSDVGSSIAETDEVASLDPLLHGKFGTRNDFDTVLWNDPAIELNRKSLLSLISSSDSRADFNCDNSAPSLFEIDNKIEQAMVRTLSTSYVTST
jgi:hypothetical protein